MPRSPRRTFLQRGGLAGAVSVLTSPARSVEPTEKTVIDEFEVIRHWGSRKNRHWGSRKKLFAVHFRNVSGTLPRFYETFPDDGYQNMPRVMRTLREVRFNGTAIGDHIPQMINDTGLQQAGSAYCIAYMRALLKQANRDVG